MVRRLIQKCNHSMKLKKRRETVRLHIICLLQYYENHPFPYGVDFYSANVQNLKLINVAVGKTKMLYQQYHPVW